MGSPKSETAVYARDRAVHPRNVELGGNMFTRRIAVIGTGYVGLTTGACLASLGHRVTCADVDELKIDQLRKGEVAIHEPGLSDLVAEGLASGRLEFIVGARSAFRDDLDPIELMFLCVPTPMGHNGAADLRSVDSVFAEIRELLPVGCIVVNKSTVPIGTAARVAELLGRADVAVVSNPEFLREGSAVHDFLNPDRIVVGSDGQDAAERVAALYARLGAPTVITDPASSEMVKYASNCFLAMKLSYVNAIAELCERLGADIVDVTEGMGFDHRIGHSFLQPGPGWGGSCLPKDTHAFLAVAQSAEVDFPLLRAAIDINARQRGRIVDKIRDAVGGSLMGTRIAMLGLAFKAGTADLRDSPALAVAELLAAEGAELTAYDPAVLQSIPGVTDVARIVDDPYEAAKGAAAVVLFTEWPDFRAIDWSKLAEEMDGRVVVDTRNHLDPDMLQRAGILWRGVGRPMAA
jgi:UDPglucose 6-dehydrogenase